MNRIIILIAFCGLCACKKSSAPAHQSDTFFKTYNTHISNWAGPATTGSASGAITSDAGGNLYCWYFDSCIVPQNAGYTKFIGSINRIAILKTDIYGNKVWSKSYFAFTPGYLSTIQDYVDNTFSDNFVCSGQNLYLAGVDSAGNFAILKFNTDGQFTGEILLDNFAPPSKKISGISKLTLTNEGNLMVNLAYYLNPTLTKPLLLLLDPSGNLIWVEDYFSPKAGNEVICSVIENNDGSFMTITEGTQIFNIIYSGGNYVSELCNFYYNLYHINAAGQLLFTHSFPAGTLYESADNLNQLYNCNEVLYNPCIFSTPGGYVLAFDCQYNNAECSYIKLLQIDTTTNIIDSAIINSKSSAQGNIIITDAIQKKDGSILIAASNPQNPNNITCISKMFLVTPGFGIQSVSNIEASSESSYISGIMETADGHVVSTGLIQTFGEDTNNLFILKMDKNEHY